MAIHDCLYVCIGDGSGPARSSSIRTRATVAEVTGWRFIFPSWDPPNFSIRWETHRKLLLFVSNPTRRHRHLRTVLPVLLQTETSGMELPDIVKDFSTVDLKGNEDKILRSNC